MAIRPAMMALVVAMAGMILPAMAITRGKKNEVSGSYQGNRSLHLTSNLLFMVIW